MAPVPLKSDVAGGNYSEDNISDAANSTTNQTNPISTIIKHMTIVMNNLTRVQFAYLTIALYLVVLSFCFMVMCCCSRQGLFAMRSEEVQPDYMIKQETRGFRVQILVLLFFFYFLYVGMEGTYGGLVMSFSVQYLHWTKAEGTLLTSLFWGSFALGRGISIFAGVCMSPALMLIADLVMTCLALAGLVLALDSNSMVLWFCTAVLGAGMASIFPTGITWAERYMLVTGKATSVLVVGSALGAMIVPAMTGYLFETKGPMWLLYIMLGAGLLAAILYIIMQNLASNKGERYEKLSHWLRSAGTDSGNEEQELEMDSLASNSTTNLLEIVSPSSSSISSNGKKKVSFNLPKEINPKNISIKYRPSFMGKSSSKED